MAKYISIFLGFIIVIYPFAVYWGVSALGVGSAALLIACLFLVRLFWPTTFYGVARYAKSVRWLAVIGFLLAVLSWLMHDPQWFKYYPVAVNIIFFAVFFASLIRLWCEIYENSDTGLVCVLSVEWLCGAIYSSRN